MENWININQKRSYEWGLNSVQEKLCAYYSKKHSWVSSRIEQSDGDYLCIAICKLIQELPTLGKKSNVSKALNSLVQKGIFEKRINNKREIFYRFNPKFLICWSDNSKKIVSNLVTQELDLIDLGVSKSGAGVSKSGAGVSKSGAGVSKSGVQKWNYHNKQIK